MIRDRLTRENKQTFINSYTSCTHGKSSVYKKKKIQLGVELPEIKKRKVNKGKFCSVDLILFPVIARQTLTNRDFFNVSAPYKRKTSTPFSELLFL